MSDLEIFLGRCLIVGETAADTWAVFLCLPHPWQIAENRVAEDEWHLVHAHAAVRRAPEEADTDGAIFEAFDAFAEDVPSRPTRAEAEADLAAMKACILAAVRGRQVTW